MSGLASALHRFFYNQPWAIHDGALLVAGVLAAAWAVPRWRRLSPARRAAFLIGLAALAAYEFLMWLPLLVPTALLIAYAAWERPARAPSP